MRGRLQHLRSLHAAYGLAALAFDVECNPQALAGAWLLNDYKGSAGVAD